MKRLNTTLPYLRSITACRPILHQNHKVVHQPDHANGDTTQATTCSASDNYGNGEEVENEDLSRSPSPQLESMTSSSSTIVPPTPKPQTKALDHQHSDEPTAYNQITGDRDEREWRVAAETLKEWHNGVKIPFKFEPVEGGISEEVVEDWKSLKQEKGVECMVIDKIVANSDRTTTTASTSRLPKEQKARRSGRFYNIYNTYVYGDSSKPSSLTNGGFLFGIAR